jgi:CBS domain containing-hemolysin-like protein
VKDLFSRNCAARADARKSLKRDILFVPENSTVESLLSQFIEHKTHMAVCSTSTAARRIVSLENITEELFGQIQDEFDRERPEIEPLGNGRYRVRGDYLIEDLADRLKIDLGEPEEETVGGYVGRAPRPRSRPRRSRRAGRPDDHGARGRTLPRPLGDRATKMPRRKRSKKKRPSVSGH